MSPEDTDNEAQLRIDRQRDEKARPLDSRAPERRLERTGEEGEEEQQALQRAYEVPPVDLDPEQERE